MKALILAAGRGSRLAPLTDNIPKCMVAYQNKPIIDYEYKALQDNGITDISIVGGYLYPVLKNYLKDRHMRFFFNERFGQTNMVATMFCAKDLMLECIDNKEDLIISYADIVYQSETIAKLKTYNGELGIIIDKDWEKQWKQRFTDPLSDAETLKIQDGKIIEIGKKPISLDEVQGQYIGLFKISHTFLPQVIDFYEKLDKNALYDGKDFDNMYMTSFLQAIILRYQNAEPVFIHGGWTEIDSIEDLKVCL
ncbi:phosphocholine cytidylyltransferase family protein [Helicobacter sp. 11S02596-1]|uniref:phosphocholine cytidylyltransferase family protein n=1 Tax=Helicobacter sp. 11S02596-1 TaxID=1476194 RepID=UPI000BA5CAC8|nr:phosphocholine cytidylyltransferase family protein [Helicobacter sp. 11S02596-1]PAF45188.1 sugar nucleotidyltransferase [Helicobacter sp. 11S02596-1]